MAKTFRDFEQALEFFFRREGRPACRAPGDLYIGAVSPCLVRSADFDGPKTEMVIDPESRVEVISLTDLARHLADEFAA